MVKRHRNRNKFKNMAEVRSHRGEAYKQTSGSNLYQVYSQSIKM